MGTNPGQCIPLPLSRYVPQLLLLMADRIGGESYLDVKERCHRILMKLVGTRDSVLIVAHKAVIRVILSFFRDIPGELMPGIEVKNNTVYELEPTAYGTNTTEYTLLES